MGLSRRLKRGKRGPGKRGGGAKDLEDLRAHRVFFFLPRGVGKLNRMDFEHLFGLSLKGIKPFLFQLGPWIKATIVLSQVRDLAKQNEKVEGKNDHGKVEEISDITAF